MRHDVKASVSQVLEDRVWPPLTPQAEFTDLWSVSSFGVFLTCPASAHFPYYDAIYDARPFQRQTAPDVVAVTLFK